MHNDMKKNRERKKEIMNVSLGQLSAAGYCILQDGDRGG